MTGIAVQRFIIRKMKEQKINRKEFALRAGIAYSSVNELINATQQNPSFTTTLKIANSFGASLNEVIGIKPQNKHQSFSAIETEEALSNLREYIQNKLRQDIIKPRILAKEVGLTANAIAEFIKEPPAKKSLGTHIISKLAQHWQISIDEMLGRVERNQEKTLKQSTNKPQTFVKRLQQQRSKTISQAKLR